MAFLPPGSGSNELNPDYHWCCDSLFWLSSIEESEKMKSGPESLT